MNHLRNFMVFLAGSLLGVLLGGWLHGPLRQVRAAADPNLIESGCVSSIPSSWGGFRGTSTHGFVFEDNQGTIRVIQHPPCGQNGGTPRLDMIIKRH